MQHSPYNANLRLLFVSSVQGWGSGERWILDAAQGLAVRGHDVEVIARPGSRLLARAAEAELHRRAVRTERALDPRTVWTVRRALRALRPHAVFVQLEREVASVAIGSWGAAAPLLFHRAEPRTGHAVPLRRSFWSRRITRTLASSAAARQWLQQQPALRTAPIAILHPGIDLSPAMDSQARIVLRRRLKLPSKRPLVVHAGMLEQGKAQETTLEALAALMTTHAGAVPEVAFVGTGPDESRLHDRCHRLGVQDQVHWVGFRPNASNYIAAANVVVLPAPATCDTWTLLEAMAQRVPVIAGNTPAFADILRDGHNALLVPRADPAALAAAVDRLLADANLATRLAENAIATLRDDWSARAMLDDVESLVYASLLRRQPEISRRALFVDRDDTLIRNVPYNADPSRVELLPGVARALQWVREAGIPIVVVSNQSGIARGQQTEDDVRAVNARMREQLQLGGADVDDSYWCPHADNAGCDCRKPEPGLLRRAAREHEIDLGQSLMVGNARRDLEAGRAAGTSVVGYAGAGVDCDLPATEARYESWTGLVRDYLRTLVAGGELPPHPAVAAHESAAGTRTEAGAARASGGTPAPPDAPTPDSKATRPGSPTRSG